MTASTRDQTPVASPKFICVELADLIDRQLAGGGVEVWPQTLELELLSAFNASEGHAATETKPIRLAGVRFR